MDANFTGEIRNIRHASYFWPEYKTGYIVYYEKYVNGEMTCQMKLTARMNTKKECMAYILRNSK